MDTIVNRKYSIAELFLIIAVVAMIPYIVCAIV